MKVNIEVSSQMLNDIVCMSDAQRDFAEGEKFKEYLDQRICDVILIKHHGVANPNAVTVNEVKKEILNKIDVIFVLISFCKNIDEIEAIKKLGDNLGRRSKIKINIGSLEEYFRKVLLAIEKEYEISVTGRDDKLLIRRKVNAIIEIINNSINSGKSKF